MISAYEITLARCCGHVCFTGFISVLTTFWPQDFKNPYVYLLEFRKVHMQVPCGPGGCRMKIFVMIGRVGPMRGLYGAHMIQQTTGPTRVARFVKLVSYLQQAFPILGKLKIGHDKKLKHLFFYMAAIFKHGHHL